MNNAAAAPTAAQQAAASTDVQLAFDTLRAKAAPYELLWKFYRGQQPQRLTDRLLVNVFGTSSVRFTRNWCRVVIKSTADRIHLEGFDVQGDDTATKKLAELVDATELLIEADDAHDGALVVGEAFVLVWPDENNEPQVAFNDASTCHLFYQSANPRKARMGAKWWVDEIDGRLHLTLYYSSEIQYYVSTKKAADVASAAALVPDADLATAVNPYGIVPFFHLRPDRTSESDLADAMTIQDQINIISTNLMISAGFGGSPQKWVISAVSTQGKIKMQPNTIIDLAAGDGQSQPTQVGQFAATDLKNFSEAINDLTAELGAITSTPKHYFGGQGGDPSGEALITMEAPLVKKATDRIIRFKLVWRQLASFLLLIAGVKVPPGKITPRFSDPRTVQPKTRSEIRQANNGAGIPLATTLREEGKSQPEIDQVLSDKAEADTAQSNGLAAALLTQQRQFDQGGGAHA